MKQMNRALTPVMVINRFYPLNNSMKLLIFKTIKQYNSMH